MGFKVHRNAAKLMHCHIERDSESSRGPPSFLIERSNVSNAIVILNLQCASMDFHVSNALRHNQPGIETMDAANALYHELSASAALVLQAVAARAKGRADANVHNAATELTELRARNADLTASLAALENEVEMQKRENNRKAAADDGAERARQDLAAATSAIVELQAELQTAKAAAFASEGAANALSMTASDASVTAVDVHALVADIRAEIAWQTEARDACKAGLSALGEQLRGMRDIGDKAQRAASDASMSLAELREVVAVLQQQLKEAQLSEASANAERAEVLRRTSTLQLEAEQTTAALADKTKEGEYRNHATEGLCYASKDTEWRG
jgi:hypothetical protein